MSGGNHTHGNHGRVVTMESPQEGGNHRGGNHGRVVTTESARDIGNYRGSNHGRVVTMELPWEGGNHLLIPRQNREQLCMKPNTGFLVNFFVMFDASVETFVDLLNEGFGLPFFKRLSILFAHIPHTIHT